MKICQSLFRFKPIDGLTLTFFLTNSRHDNVLPLYGYCFDDAGKCLVYQYMAGGSLEFRLHGCKARENPLSFKKRKEIAQQTACGLQYLHTFHEKPLIHGDIKPANILLDDFGIPKIGDFGLVRVGENESMEISSVFGTRPYLPKEFLEHRIFSTKVDTYSYGIVLFELLTGQKAYDAKRESPGAFLATHMRSNSNEPAHKFIDPILDQTQVCIQTYMHMMKIAYRCIEKNVNKRPKMDDVYNEFNVFVNKK